MGCPLANLYLTSRDTTFRVTEANSMPSPSIFLRIPLRRAGRAALATCGILFAVGLPVMGSAQQDGEEEIDPALVPENGYADGDSWDCERGFRQVDGRCELLEVPEHGFLRDAGDQWRCERGYKRTGGKCELVVVPEHAFLKNRGDAWECDRGFKRESDVCEPVEIPENAYLTSRGRDWECVRGYRKFDGRCALVPVPSNGFLNQRGSDFKCDRGFKRKRRLCIRE